MAGSGLVWPAGSLSWPDPLVVAASGQAEIDVFERDPADGQPGQGDLPAERPAGQRVQHGELVLGADLDLTAVDPLAGYRQAFGRHIRGQPEPDGGHAGVPAA